VRTLFCCVALVGCFTLTSCSFAKLPPIKGHHWNRAPFGANLYDDATGREAASFIGTALDSAQVCRFDADERCEYFDTDKAALAWLAEQYKEPWKSEDR